MNDLKRNLRRLLTGLLAAALIWSEAGTAYAATDPIGAAIVSQLDEADDVGSTEALSETASADEEASSESDVSEEASDESVEEQSDDADLIGETEEPADDESVTELSEDDPELIGAAIKADPEKVTLDLEDDVLQYGGIPSEKRETEEVPELESNLTDTIRDGKKRLDVSEYGLSVDEITDIVVDVINENPDFFTLLGAEALTDEAGDVQEIVLLYDSDSRQKSIEYERAVAKILDGMDSDWSDEEKLFYLHDYIVTHCQYDLTYSDYTAYGVLVEHCSVCQGYALAFMDLANRAGINTYYVSSEGINHAWNLVELNEKLYFVDCTWDDPIPSGEAGQKAHYHESYCRHNNFLQSKEGMTANNHTSRDWVIDRTTDIYDNTSYNGKQVGNEYDSACWQSASYSPVVCMDDYILYVGKPDLNSSSTAVCRYDLDGNSGSIMIDNLGNYTRWGVWGGSGSWIGHFGSLVSDGTDVYLCDSKAIYKLDLATNTLSQIYMLTSGELGTGYLFGLQIEGSTLYYYLSRQYSDDSLVKKGTIDISGNSGSTVTSITLDPNSLLFDGIGQTATITANTEGSSQDVVWTSQNPSVATVENGVVTSTGYGTTAIFAKIGKVSDVCIVQVDTTWQNDYTTENASTSTRNMLRLETYIGTEEDIVIPAAAYIDGVKYITELDYRLFYNNAIVKSVKLENGVGAGYRRLSLLGATFRGCQNLKTVDLTGLDAGQNGDDMDQAFYDCQNLTYVNLSGIDFSNMQSMNLAFKYCPSLKEIDFSGADFSNITSATGVFAGTPNIEKIKTPAAVNSDVSVELNKPMYVLGEDGKIGTTAYNDLFKAPVNSVLVCKKEEDISKATVTLSADSFEYTGSSIEPDVTVTYDGETLTEETDYTVSYSSNINVGSKTAKVTVTGVGSFKGSKTVTFSIVQADISGYTLRTDKSLYDHTGSAITPAFTVSNGSVTLRSGTDYTVTCRNNTDPGVAEITVTGNGNYKGEITGSFIIGNAAQNMTATIPTDKLTVGKTLPITVSGNLSDPEFVSGNTYVATVNEDGIITAVAPGNVRITVTSAANDYYKAASATIDLEIIDIPQLSKPASNVSTENEVERFTQVELSSDVSGAKIYYTTDGNVPTEASLLYNGPITLTDKKTVIKAIAVKTEYRSSEVAEYTYFVKEDWGNLYTEDDELKECFGDVWNVPDGIWYAFGNKDDGYTVYEFGAYDDAAVKSMKYTGSKLTFNDDIRVFIGTTKLLENRDYTISYTNNTNAADTTAVNAKNKSIAPTVTIKGKGNYGNSAAFKFVIAGRDIDETVITSETSVTISNGAKLNTVRPALAYNGKKLTLNKDYELKYYKGSDIMTAEAVEDPALKVQSGEEYIVQIVDKLGGNYIPHSENGPKTDTVSVTVLDSKDKTRVSVSKLKVSMPAINYSGMTDIISMFDNSTGAETTAKVKNGNTVLVYGTDYTLKLVEETDHKSAGKHKFVIVGTKDASADVSYYGTKTVTYTINGRPINKAKVWNLDTTVEYTGQLPDISGVNLYYNGMPMTKDEDYYISARPAKAVPGKYTVEFTGKGQYTGTLKKTVTIKPYNLKNDNQCLLEVKVKDADFSKSGATPEVTVKFDGKLLREGIDYTKTYKNNTVVASASDRKAPNVEITGKGYFTGVNKGNEHNKFTIRKTALTTDNVKLVAADKVYKKKAGKNYFKVTPSFMDGDKKLTVGRNKEVTLVGSYTYSFYEDCELEDGRIGYKGNEILPTDVLKPGTTVVVTAYLTVDETENPKSPFDVTDNPVMFTAQYKILGSGFDIKSAKVSLKNESKARMAFNDCKSIPIKAEDFILKIGGTTLDTGDYIIESVKNNRFLGTTKVTFRGTGDYGGTKTYSFKISPRHV